jgi:hypothetical protein
VAIVKTPVHAVSDVCYGRMSNENSPELPMYTGQIGLGSRKGYTQTLGDLAVVQPFDVMQNYHCPSAFW